MISSEDLRIAVIGVQSQNLLTNSDRSTNDIPLTRNRKRSMASELAVDYLRKNLVKEFSELREKLRKEGSTIDLSGADLSNISIVNANLSGVNLRGARFSGSELTHVDLYGADATECSFRGATLSRCRMSGASLRQSTFEDCELIRVQFAATDLSESNFTDASIISCRFIAATVTNTVFDGAEFSNTEFVAVNDLSTASMKRIVGKPELIDSLDMRSITINVEIHIEDAEPSIELEKLENIQNSVGNFLQAFGFEYEPEHEPEVVLASWHWFAKFKSAGKKTRDEAVEIYDEMKEALRRQQIDKAGADAFNQRALAAAELLKSLEPYPEAVARLGDIIVAKAEIDGVPRVAIESISPKLARELEARPGLTTNARLFFDYLDSIQPQPQESISENQPNLIEGTATRIESTNPSGAEKDA